MQAATQLTKENPPLAHPLNNRPKHEYYPTLPPLQNDRTSTYTTLILWIILQHQQAAPSVYDPQNAFLTKPASVALIY